MIFRAPRFRGTLTAIVAAVPLGATVFAAALGAPTAAPSSASFNPDTACMGGSGSAAHVAGRPLAGVYQTHGIGFDNKADFVCYAISLAASGTATVTLTKPYWNASASPDAVLPNGNEVYSGKWTGNGTTAHVSLTTLGYMSGGTMKSSKTTTASFTATLPHASCKLAISSDSAKVFASAATPFLKYGCGSTSGGNS